MEKKWGSVFFLQLQIDTRCVKHSHGKEDNHLFLCKRLHLPFNPITQLSAFRITETSENGYKSEIKSLKCVK